MLNWLKKPYFFITSIKFNLILSLIISVFIFLFLYVFQPFGMFDMQQQNVLLYCFGFGVVTFLVQNFMFLVLPKLLKKTFKDESWTVWKNILFFMTLISLISVFNWLYNNQMQIVDDNSSLLTFSQITSYTFTIGVFPVFIFTFIAERYCREKREKVSNEIMKQKSSKIILKKEKQVTIFGTNKEENISFYLTDLIYITSQGNYASFFLNSDDGIKEHILRNTLTNINSDLDSFSNIIRCHKSYIINSNHINSIAGNARGYFLTSLLTTKQIPVSRKYNKEKLQDLLI